MTSKDIVAAYYKNFTTQSDEDYWAWEAVVDLCRDLKQGLDITLELIGASDDELYLAYVAAGPVEDLIKWHGAQAVRAFEMLADDSDKVRRVLVGINLSPSADGYSEWLRVLTKYGLAPPALVGNSKR